MDSVAQSTTTDDGVQRCAWCHAEKPLSAFWTGEKACKDCRNARKKQLHRGEVQPSRVRAGRRQNMPLPEAEPQVGETPRLTAYAIMQYQGVEIAFESDVSKVCLTDLWRAAGSPVSSEPFQWARQDQAKGLIAQYLWEQNDLSRDQVITSRRGETNSQGGGGTWAPREIALAYAQYLSPALHLACNRFVLDRASQFVGQARGLTPAAEQVLTALLHQNNQILSVLGCLPAIDHRTSHLVTTMAGVERMITKQVVLGQVYVVRVLYRNLLEMACEPGRMFRLPPNAQQALLAVGQTGPDGDIFHLRLVEYFGKIKPKREDFEILAVIATDAPQKVEEFLLKTPVSGAVRLRRCEGGYSQTFIAADARAIATYREIGKTYHTERSIRALLCGAQSDMFPESGVSL